VWNSLTRSKIPAFVECEVDSPVGTDRPRDESVGCTTFTQVGLNKEPATTRIVNRFDDSRTFNGIPARHDDIGATSGKCDRSGSTDSRCRAGDHNCSTLERLINF